ncbi:MAG: RDD family protein [Acidobacteriia bacterium]|nr:RDD family protein [Terriglobia bacterium]
MELGPMAGGPEPPASEPARPWQEELSERVEKFRRRRAHLKGDFDPGLSLELEFPGSSGDKTEASPGSTPPEPVGQDSALELDLDRPTVPETPASLLDSLTLGRSVEGMEILEQTESGVEESAPSPASSPVEIILDSAPVRDAEARGAVLIAPPLAPMGRRFLGGVIDALVLLISAGIFAVIFWRAGGRLTPNPLNFAVAAFIAVAISLAYFGVFTALTSTTPGLLWVGIEVRNFQGQPPTPGQALWRAFGYLVSASALLLGFVWALVDSEGLTWHDRMSDTYLASADSAVESRGSRVES